MTFMQKPWLSALIISMGLVLAFALLGNSIIEFRNFNRYVEVKGLDEKIVKADKAVWNIDFSASDKDLKQAYNQIDASQKKIVEFLKIQGFPAEGLQVQSISIQEDLYNKTDNQPTYRAQTGIIVSSNDVDKVAAALQKTSDLVEAGVIVGNSRARYFYTQLNSIKPEMLTQATSSAKEAANTFATNTQSKLGKIRHASQGIFSITSAEGGNEYENETSVMKKVRVVTSVEFFIED